MSERRYFPDDEPMSIKPVARMMRLQQAAQSLDEALTVLERALQPVLLPERSEQERMDSVVRGTDPMSPLHEEIDGVAFRLARALSRVQSMGERIDL